MRNHHGTTAEATDESTGAAALGLIAIARWCSIA
jgi:hypothetical protein